MPVAAEVQQAAKSLFGTYLAAMPDTDIVVLVEEWQDQRAQPILLRPWPTQRLTHQACTVPSRQQGEGLMHSRADHALLIVGLIAVERFKLLSSRCAISCSRKASTTS